MARVHSWTWTIQSRRVTLDCAMVECVTRAFGGGNEAREKSRICGLINPANAGLLGTRLAYFPKGGPVPRPPPSSVGTNSWGGMEAGAGMLYPSQVVDGVVTALGGRALRAQLDAIPEDGVDEVGQPMRCAVGEAVVTTQRVRLAAFDTIAHTVPPFWPSSSSSSSNDSEEWARSIGSCYTASVRALLRAAPSSRGAMWVASPLLGAGARGAPIEAAAKAAAAAIGAVVEYEIAIESPQTDDFRFQFAVREGKVFNILCDALNHEVESRARLRSHAVVVVVEDG